MLNKCSIWELRRFRDFKKEKKEKKNTISRKQTRHHLYLTTFPIPGKKKKKNKNKTRNGEEAQEKKKSCEAAQLGSVLSRQFPL